jgi:hypothetical protein
MAIIQYSVTHKSLTILVLTWSGLYEMAMKKPFSNYVLMIGIFSVFRARYKFYTVWNIHVKKLQILSFSVSQFKSLCLPIPNATLQQPWCLSPVIITPWCISPKPGIEKRCYIINAGWLYLKKRGSNKNKRKVRSIILFLKIHIKFTYKGWKKDVFWGKGNERWHLNCWQ